MQKVDRHDIVDAQDSLVNGLADFGQLVLCGLKILDSGNVGPQQLWAGEGTFHPALGQMEQLFRLLAVAFAHEAIIGLPRISHIEPISAEIPLHDLHTLLARFIYALPQMLLHLGIVCHGGLLTPHSLKHTIISPAFFSKFRPGYDGKLFVDASIISLYYIFIRKSTDII